MEEEEDNVRPALAMPVTRGYQQEMLEESLRKNIIIALDTGSGKTHIAVLRLKYEMEREPTKVRATTTKHDLYALSCTLNFNSFV